MRRFAIIFFLLGISLSLYGQIRRDGVWCFGDHAMVDFNQTPPVCGTSALNTRGTSCSITDSSGNLLFYCQSYNLALMQSTVDHLGLVFNRLGQPMDNGDSLVASGWYYEMVIVPDPLNNNSYYIFHTAVDGPYGKIYYSKVDMNYNGGLGRVTIKNMFLDNMGSQNAADGITAIKHGNGRDFWVICHRYTPGNYNNAFHKFLVTPSGIQLFQQSIGPTSHDGFIRLLFNSTGNKMYMYTHFGLISSFSFDRCSGILSEPLTIHPESSNVPRLEIFAAAALSPNDRVLYMGGDQGTFFLYQLNLDDSDPYGSRILLDVDTSNISACGFIKLAPDGKLYLTRGWQGSFPYFGTTIYNSSLSVIADPNQLGLGCNYQSLVFSLGSGRSYWGLQNSPYFDMPAVGASICDSLGIFNTTEEIRINENAVYPNPCSDFIYISTEILHDFTSLTVSNMDGKILLSDYVQTTLDVRSFKPGLYLLTLTDQKHQKMFVKLLITK
jgi:hypothetical protein